MAVDVTYQNYILYLDMFTVAEYWSVWIVVTLLMHLCSPCNRRTINFYDDDDDDDDEPPALL